MNDQPTLTRDPIGYAVIQEQEGEYGYVNARHTFLIGESDDVTGTPRDDHEQRVNAGARATTLNDRDAEGVSRWHVVALVPITP